MPGEQRIGRDQSLDFIQQPAADDLGFHGESYPLFVSEPKPLASELVLENTVLRDELVDERLLIAVKPAGQGDNQKVEGLDDGIHCRKRWSVISFAYNIIRFVRVFAPNAPSLRCSA